MMGCFTTDQLERRSKKSVLCAYTCIFKIKRKIPCFALHHETRAQRLYGRRAAMKSKVSIIAFILSLICRSASSPHPK